MKCAFCKFKVYLTFFRRIFNTAEEKVDEFYLQRQVLPTNRVSSDTSGLEFGSISRSSPHYELRYRNNGNSACAAGLLNPSWIRQYTRSSSFMLGNYYMQNMMHHPWASASLHECQTSLQDLNCLLDKCQQPDGDGGCGNVTVADAHDDHAGHSKKESQNVMPVSLLPGAGVRLYNKKNDAHSAARRGLNGDEGNTDRRIPPSIKKAPLSSSPRLLDEDVRFLARVLSNARPPHDFCYTVRDAARARRKYDNDHNSNTMQGGEEDDDEESSDHGNTILFDGTHGECDCTETGPGHH
jgi:hypothetical protein